jgi:LysR family transcriptional activator of nhaA
VVKVGETEDLRERYFAISVERQISHPAVRAISEGARGRVAVD